MKKGRTGVTWSDLPKELLETIAGLLETKTNITRFRSVCKSWRSSVPPFQSPFLFPLHLPYFGPFTFLTETFLSLTQTTLYYLNQPSPFSSPSSWAGNGWLVKLREAKDGRRHCLVNPLSPQQIHPLPHSFPKTLNLLNFRAFEVAKAYSLQFPNLSFCDYKVAFSQNPDCPSLMIVASGVLWSLKLSGDGNRWRVIDDQRSQLSYNDVVLYRGRFFAVDEIGRLVMVDPFSLQVIQIVPQIETGTKGQRKSLVMSKGDLFLVDKCERRLYKYYVRFRVFKVDIRNKRLVEVRNLYDRILFFGQDCSFSVPTRCFGGRCKGNCIVFANQVYMIYSLDDGKVSLMDQHKEFINIFYPPSR